MTNQKLINETEAKDRYIASRVIESSFGENVDIQQASISSHVDLNCVYTNSTSPIPFNVEIKTRNKTKADCEKYGYCVELKLDKYVTMMEESVGKRLYYFVLLNNEICLIYDIKKLDINECEIFDWNIKIVQYNPTSPKKKYKTIKIPFDKAVKKVDIRQYIKDYEDKH